MHEAGFSIEYIHTGPVIRREGVFRTLSIAERRKLLYKMLNFTNACPVKYECVVVNRKEALDKEVLSERLEREISQVLKKHYSFFTQFEKIVVYYDNGQVELSTILKKVFYMQFSKVEFRSAEPQRYRLLQVADFICSIELLKIKWQEHRLSISEEKFFYKPQELKKTFIKSIEKKHL